MNPQKQFVNGLYRPEFEHDACGVGFVVNVKGEKNHGIVAQALQVLHNLDHRGATGAETNTGDGAGILIQVPHKFFAKVTRELGFTLPAAGEYGVGMWYMPPSAAQAKAAQEILAGLCKEEGLSLLGWRKVPSDNSSLGKSARAAEPCDQGAGGGFSSSAASGKRAAAYSLLGLPRGVI